MMPVILSAFLLLMAAGELMAGSIRLRAREHFEISTVRYGGLNDSENYSGTTNTLNVWYEEPFRYAFGFAGGPMLGSARTDHPAPLGTDAQIRLWHFGVEGKYFVFPAKNGFFGRAGLSGLALDTRGSEGTLWGAGVYAGLGWEFKIGKVGIAPELAVRQGWLERSSQIFSFTPSIGLHFYGLPAKLK